MQGIKPLNHTTNHTSYVKKYAPVITNHIFLGFEADVQKISLCLQLSLCRLFVVRSVLFALRSYVRQASARSNNKSFTHCMYMCVSYSVWSKFFFLRSYFFFLRAPAWWGLKINYRKIASWHVFCCRVFVLLICKSLLRLCTIFKLYVRSRRYITAL